MNAKQILNAVRADHLTLDPYGTASEHAFDIGEAFYVVYGEFLPEFRPSPMIATESDLESGAREYADQMMNGGISESDARYVFGILSRYLTWVELAGRGR